MLNTNSDSHNKSREMQLKESIHFGAGTDSEDKPVIRIF